MSEKKNVRVTKAQKFETAIAYLLGQDAPEFSNADGDTATVSVEDCVAALRHEIDLLAKKNASDSKKKKENDQKNEGYKALIIDYLAGTAEGKTCTEIGKNIPELNDFTTPKISSLANALVEEKRARKASVKGKTLFYYNAE